MELSELLRKTGFEDVSSETFYHGESIFMNQDASLFLLAAIKPARDQESIAKSLVGILPQDVDLDASRAERLKKYTI